MTRTEVLVTFERVSKSYGHKVALRDVSFVIRKGVIFGCVGPNGAGKTTIVRLMLGLLEPDSGVVRVFGEDPTRLSLSGRRRIGHVLEAQCLYADLTVRENIEFFASIYGIHSTSAQEIGQIPGAPKISEYVDKPAGWLSKGMKQQIAIWRAMLPKPDLLILDEPTSGLDPIYQRRIQRILREYRNAGNTIFLCSHDMAQIERLCDMVLFLKDGESLGVVSVDELRRSASGNAWVVKAASRKSKELLLTMLRPRYFCLNSSEDLSFEVRVPEAGEDRFLACLSSEPELIQEVRRAVPTFERTFFKLMNENED